MRSFIKTEESAAGGGTAVAEAPAAVTQGATPAPSPTPTSQAVALPAHGRYCQGDIDKSDIRTPWLSCVQAVGPKSQLFPQGSLVLGEVAITQPPVLPNPTPRVRLLIMHAVKTFVQNLPYNPSPTAPRAKVLNTADQVRAESGTLVWVGNVAPTYMPKTTCFALVRCPDKFEDGQFNIIAGTNTYAPAMISFQKTSYGAAKTLWTDLNLSLKGNPMGTFYDLFYAREQRGQNLVWVAKLVRARDEKPDAAILAIGEKLSGGNLSFEDSSDTE